MRDGMVVLVHGAWHGPWCWERVTPLLDAQGIRWIAVQLPSCDPATPAATLADDALAVRCALDTLGSPAIVLGHSYGGMAITEGAAAHPAVRHLVYLCAFMPDAGESALSLITSEGGALGVVEALRATEDGRTYIAPERVVELFFGDCDAEIASWAAAQLTPMHATTADAVSHVAWRDIPSTYVVATQDRAVPPAVQRRMSERATERLSWDTSHSPFASRPDLVAGLLAELVARA